MKAADLRQAILQAAVQGKLVSQDPNDEPASELLKRIVEEKVKRIKEGEIKKEKLLSPFDENEIPRKLPINWIWCKLGNICIANPRNLLKDELDVSFLPMTLISSDYFGGHRQDKRLWKAVKSGFTHFAENDVLLAKITPCFQNGKSCIAKQLINFFGAGTTELHVFRCLYVLPKYLLLFFKTPTFLYNGVANMTGTAGQQRVPISYILNYPFPLPPVKEQQRIVAKVDELMALCDKLEAAEKELELLEDHFAEYLPKSILQMAVQGKLVPQNPEDEPASELLKRIQVEKTKLVKEGKIKKEKPLPAITKDKIPYELPQGWEWCYLNDVGEIVGGATPDTHNNSFFASRGEGISWLTPADIKNSKQQLIFHGSRDLTQKGFNSCSAKLLPVGSVVYSSRAPIGHIALAGQELCTNQGFKSVVPYNMTTNKWIYNVLKYKTEDIQGRASGTTFKEVSGQFMAKEIIPFPPLAEQQRIVAKIEELMQLCDSLKKARTAPIKADIDNSKILQFPKPQDASNNGPLAIAARGTVSEEISPEHQAALDELLSMMEDDA